ncbi:MAG TPA: hypothetical protein ENI55_06335 [Alphaproteobacteria bacterium]|nr:hypothetical protein [Alphaproteobacteria bacterium]
MEDTKPVTFPRALALAVVFGVLTAAAPDAMAKPLEEELSSILIDHPNIRAGYKTIESSRQDIAKARAGYFPTVAATGSGGPEYIDSPGERARRANGKAWMRSKVLAGVTVTQNMFSGYATAAAVKTARLNREIAEITLEGTRQSTMFEGITAYIDVLRQKRLIELARTNELTIERQLNLEDERVRRGSGITVDVLQAKSRLQLAKERLITFEGALEDAVSRYFQVFGHSPEIENMTDPVPPVNILPSGLERALEISLTENPAVGNSNTAVEMARESRTMVRSEYFPVVDLVGSWNYELNNNTVTGTRRDGAIVLSTNWTLFNGFTTRAGLTQATYNYRASKDNFDYTNRKVVEQTKLAWQALLTSRLRLGLLENAINIAGEVFISRKRLRDAGKETVINVLDAESEVNNAQIDYTSASYDERLAVYQLMLAMGRLNAKYLGLPPI